MSNEYNEAIENLRLAINDISIQIDCNIDEELYDQPLKIQLSIIAERLFSTCGYNPIGIIDTIESQLTQEAYKLRLYDLEGNIQNN